jgi:excisionase family DNA binding protein
LADALASLLRAVPAASQLLTKSQAATMLGVGRTRTLQRLIDTGALRTVKLGTRARIPLAEVERFLVEGEQPVPSPPPTARPTRRPVVRHLPGPGNLADQLAEVRGMRI